MVQGHPQRERGDQPVMIVLCHYPLLTVFLAKVLDHPWDEVAADADA